MERTNSNYNYNKRNIADARASMKNGCFRSEKGQVFTMLQKNSPCEVTITKESRKICADILTKV